MTLPFDFEETSGPQRARRNWLLRYLGVQEKYDSLIHTALHDAAEDAAQGIRQRVDDNRVGSSTRRYQLGLARSAARSTIQLLFSGLFRTIASGQSDAAVAAVEAGFVDDDRILRRLFPDASKRANFQDSMRQSASRGVQAMVRRIVDTSRPLSEQVYRTRALANGQVDRIINSALVKGDSASDIAKAVRDSIRPDVKGGVGYAAKRLGRTEINNAFHAQSIDDIKTKPWVNSADWHLSKSHIYSPAWISGSRDIDIEICERYSLMESFPKDQVPLKGHPQCLCYTTPRLVGWQEFENNLLAGIYNNYIDEEL